MLSRSVTIALLWMLASGPPAPAGARLPTTAEDAIQHATADELRAHVNILASDKLAGRGVGHPGNQTMTRNGLDFPKLERITALAARLAWMAADGEAPRFKARHE